MKMTQLEMARNLMAMDEFICDEMGDETWEIWITFGVPDDNYICVEDYLWLVETEEDYKEFVELFNKLVKGKKKDKFFYEYLPKVLDYED